MTTKKNDDSKPDAVPEKAPKPVSSIKTDSVPHKRGDEPTDMPMPKGVPKKTTLASSANITAEQVKELDKSKDHIQPSDDSGQSTPTSATLHKTDQIDAKGTNITTESLPVPSASPPTKKDMPVLPFNEKDVMTSKPTLKSNGQVPAVRGVVVPADTSAKDLDRQMSAKKTAAWLQSQGSSYNVQGTYRPDAASIQGAANKNKVSTEILKATQTNDYAEVIVRTHLGDQYVDTVVHHSFETSKQIKLLEMATKHPDTVHSFSADGMPIFKPGAVFEDNFGKKKNLMLTVMHTLLADIQFSIRDATTKAAAAGQAKILNQDWQGAEEIESEARERELVETLRDH